MNEQLKHNLQQIAADNIPDDVNLWPQTHARLQLTPQPTHTLRGQPVRLSATLVALLILGLALFSTPARTWAQDAVDDLLTRWGFFSRAKYVPPPLEEAMPAQQPSMYEHVVTCADGSVLSSWSDDPSAAQHGNGLAGNTRTEAQAQVNFPVKVPTYTPEGYCVLDDFDVLAEQQLVTWMAHKLPTGHPQIVDQREVIPAAEFCSTHRAGIFELTQLPSNQPYPSDWVLPVGPASAANVTVNGSPGVWLQDAPTGFLVYEEPEPITNPNQQLGAIPAASTTVCPLLTNMLAWEQDGVRYLLRASFPLAEMQRIAASLR